MLAIPVLVASAQSYDLKVDNGPSDYPRLYKYCNGKYVIRCNPAGGGECYASWQELC